MKKSYILVTGGSGYIGLNLVKHLIHLKFNVISLDLKKNLFTHKNLKKFESDITNYDDIHGHLKPFQISFIYHLAAVSDIDYSVSNPKKTLNNNIFSTYNLLKIASLKKIKKFIFASTIYNNSTQGSFYRISKICSEEIIEEYKRLHNIDFTIIRYGSLFGDFNFDNTINNIIKHSVQNKVIKREGNGSEIRNYISVHDAVLLSAKLLEKKYNKNYYNIIGNENLSFRQIIKIIHREIPSLKIKYTNTNNPHHYLKSPFNKKSKNFNNLSINKKNYFYNKIKYYIDEFKK